MFIPESSGAPSPEPPCCLEKLQPISASLKLVLSKCRWGNGNPRVPTCEISPHLVVPPVPVTAFPIRNSRSSMPHQGTRSVSSRPNLASPIRPPRWGKLSNFTHNDALWVCYIFRRCIFLRRLGVPPRTALIAGSRGNHMPSSPAESSPRETAASDAAASRGLNKLIFPCMSGPYWIRT